MMRLTKSSLIYCVLAVISLAGMLCATDQSTAKVEGQIQLVPADAAHPIKDFSQVVVWLVPTKTVKVDPPSEHFRMAQKDKMFEPNLLVVPVGSVVDFPNLDPWFHNVFSLFRGKRFDLGLYQAGSQRSVKFDRPGVSYLFCNIHPEMTAQVVVVDSKWFAATDAKGHFSIASVPDGSYELHIFYKASEPEALRRLQRRVEIAGQDRTLAPITLVVQRSDTKPHKNKYGHDYDPEQLKPEY